MCDVLGSQLKGIKVFLGIKMKLMVQERLRLKMAIGFNNMKFTDNLAKGSLSMTVNPRLKGA